MRKKQKCRVEACEEIATTGHAGFCSACYQGLYRWMGRTPADLVERATKLKRLSSRLDMIQNKGKNK